MQVLNKYGFDLIACKLRSGRKQPSTSSLADIVSANMISNICQKQLLNFKLRCCSYVCNMMYLETQFFEVSFAPTLFKAARYITLTYKFSFLNFECTITQLQYIPKVKTAHILKNSCTPIKAKTSLIQPGHLINII